MATTAVFAGLVMAPEMIKTILRSDIMKESAFYQEILQEGRLEGRLEGERKGRLEGEREGKLKVGQQLLQLGMSLSQVAQVTGFSEQELQQRLSG
jgi:predicted transposase/invertase (TIGR01784 family)